MNQEVIICLVVFALMVLDIVTGLVNAVKEGAVSSAVMREGLYHKFGSIVVVFLGLACGYFGAYIGMDATVCATASNGVVAMVGVMELTSVLENCCKLNGDLPIAKVFSFFGIEKGGE